MKRTKISEKLTYIARVMKRIDWLFLIFIKVCIIVSFGLIIFNLFYI